MGDGKPHHDKQWWFDLEELDGAIEIPKKKRGTMKVWEDVTESYL
jgi:hypothetical protein